MTDDKIKAAVAAAKEFIARSKPVLADHGTYQIGGDTFKRGASPRDTGALRRQSMELTRALANMRRSS